MTKYIEVQVRMQVVLFGLICVILVWVCGFLSVNFDSENFSKYYYSLLQAC